MKDPEVVNGGGDMGALRDKMDRDSTHAPLVQAQFVGKACFLDSKDFSESAILKVIMQRNTGAHSDSLLRRVGSITLFMKVMGFPCPIMIHFCGRALQRLHGLLLPCLMLVNLHGMLQGLQGAGCNM